MKLRQHLVYFQYMLRHKWRVFRVGLEIGVPLRRLILHDWSKFTLNEWPAYVEKFYSDRPAPRVEWQRALVHHYRRNDHHPEYWVLFGSPVPMPEICWREMVADWRSFHDSWDSLQEWYEQGDERARLHSETCQKVELFLKRKCLADEMRQE